ncbi:ABC transporter related protein [Desulfovibrio sp. X2]|uniref:ATP-binding cassette domain-containing protein n=1 Tax=Desulfovibrio sp. X2 TaxID=941449 RepID=UPI000358F45A|nr:ATP-binding cassette domain-containing protein [Desulfovibrio sp. X2]EPR43587.1 ABC transporter related protein [Desulfovibrio sp. X2]
MQDGTLVRFRQAGVRRGRNLVLGGLDWELAAGESWAVFGANGAGKSTFLSLVRGDIWPSEGERTYFVDGRPQVSPLGFREKSALVSAEQQLWYVRAGVNPTALDVAVAGLRDTPLAYGRVRDDELAAARAALAAVGLAELEARLFSSLSQGQQRRVLLARALAGKPRLLVLDECLEGLDAAAREEMLASLRAQAERRGEEPGVQLLYATHRPEEARALGLSRGLVVEAGKVVFAGSLDEAAARAFPDIGDGAGEAAPVVPASSVSEPGGKGAPAFLLAFEKVTAVRGGRAVLVGLDWTVRPGEHWAVLGPNGAGKSTLLALAAGDLHPVAGRVGRFGRFKPMSLWEIRRRTALVSFDLHVIHEEDMTGLAVVVSGLRGHIGLHEAATPEEEARARALLFELGLAELAQRSVESFSSGQLRRLLLARALVAGPRLLLLDEPFAGLDAPSRAAMRRTLAAMAGRGASLVMTSHHADDLPDVPMRTLRLSAPEDAGNFAGTYEIGVPEEEWGD